MLDTARRAARVPVLRDAAARGSAARRRRRDIDVHACTSASCAAARQRGAQLFVNFDVAPSRFAAGRWALATPTRRFTRAACSSTPRAPGPTPSRRLPACARSACSRSAAAPSLSRRPPALDARAWPCVAGIDEDFYFKPDAGLLLGSPANADPVAPHDVVAEELDIAIGIARIEAATTLTIRRPLRTWAGLRSFVPDGALVGGFDDAGPASSGAAARAATASRPAPAMGEACAASLLGRALPAHIADAGFSFADLACRR